MSRFPRFLLSTVAVISLGTAALPAVADLGVGAVAGRGPASGPGDLASKNVKLLGHLDRSAPGITQSDLAFKGKLAFAGNYQGFRVIDISSPANPKVIGSKFCNGAQGDVSVYGNLLFQSVDTPQSKPECDSTNVTASTSGAWEGVRAFDISDPTNPVLIDSYKTDCGSHTHTILPVPEDDRIYIYVSSYPITFGNIGAASNCFDFESGGGHGYVSIIEVPISNPTNETIHKYFLDDATEVATFNLDAVFDTPPGVLGTHSFIACHDIAVFADLRLLAGACLSEAQLWDIADPVNPVFLWRFDDPALDHEFGLDLWHTSAFSWDGKVVAMGDESGGGAFARCVDPTDDRGRVWFLDTMTGGLLANYKIPRSESGVCTAHNFNFIPQTNGRKTLIMANYEAGLTVVDVNALIGGASELESEVGFYKPAGTDQWSAYWYNGFMYVNDIARGVDVMLLSDRARAGQGKLDFMNPQSQLTPIK